MIHVLYGKDDFSRDEALGLLRDALDGEGIDENTERVDGRTVQPDELLARVQTVPFLASKRLIIVDGLLGKFQASSIRRGRQPRKTAASLGSWQSFIDGLASIPDSTVLVFIEGELTAENPMKEALLALKPKPSMREFPPMRTADLASWITRRANELYVRIEARAVPALTGLIGNNLRLLDSELRKLAVHAGEDPITADDVRALVSMSRDASVFAMVDAAAEGRVKDAIDEYRRLILAGEPPQRFLVMIARQYRLMLQAKELRDRGVPQSQIGTKLRIQNFVAERVLRQASGYRSDQLRDAYRLLIETDMNIKRGLYDDETGLELLLFELATSREARQGPVPPRGRSGYSTPRAGQARPR